MNKKASVSAEEAELFRETIGTIAPLPRSQRRKPQRPKLSPRPRQTERDEREVITQLLDHPIDPAMLETGDELEHRQDGVQLSVMRKLKRGQYACQAELDLHGLVVAQARQEVVVFLERTRAQGLRCVRIIHGKGLRSSQRGPILKMKVANWLRQRQEVLAYCSARPVDGGTGAVYVLLRA
jgi:DNA-nicking Smr family endonuclease